LESLAPDQAKDQLMKMIDSQRMVDVVAILKGMAIEKRKKVMGEFQDQAESDKLNEVLLQFLEGEPMRSVIENARTQSAPPAER
ncbi:MAG: hypothetical protein KDB03_02270, partial [Planctomycetales bacterium]|nr:hypothetical protein [Planctomycetales bacterium]